MTNQKARSSVCSKGSSHVTSCARCKKVLLGEVSKVNDDRVDNRFYEPTGRFPEIDEDEKPLYPLGNEYPAAK